MLQSLPLQLAEPESPPSLGGGGVIEIVTFGGVSAVPCRFAYAPVPVNRWPVSAPRSPLCGVNRTRIVHEPPAFSVVLHVPPATTVKWPSVVTFSVAAVVPDVFWTVKSFIAPVAAPSSADPKSNETGLEVTPPLAITVPVAVAIAVPPVVAVALSMPFAVVAPLGGASCTVTVQL